MESVSSHENSHFCIFQMNECHVLNHWLIFACNILLGFQEGSFSSINCRGSSSDSSFNIFPLGWLLRLWILVLSTEITLLLKTRNWQIYCKICWLTYFITHHLAYEINWLIWTKTQCIRDTLSHCHLTCTWLEQNVFLVKQYFHVAECATGLIFFN